jgi:O-antigen ligase
MKWFVNNIFNAYAVNYFWSLRVVLNLFLSILFFYYIINNVTEKTQLRHLAFCGLSGLFLSLAFGILDFHNLIDLTFFRPLNPDIQRFGYKRLMSLFWHSGWFAEYLALLSPFYLSILFLHKLKPKPVHILLTLMILYGLVFTYQRAGWISFLASVMILFIMSRRSFHFQSPSLTRFIIVILVLAVGLAFIIFIVSDANVKTSLIQRSRNVFQFKDRTSIWKQALSLYSRKPFLGVGTGNYYNYHRSTFPPGHPYFDDDKVTAHNTYLHILVERGPFALLFFLCLLGTAFHSSIKAINIKGGESDLKMIAVAVLSSLAGFVVYGLAQYMFYIRIVDVIFWFVLGLSYVISSRGEDGMKEYSGFYYKRYLLGFTVLFLFILSFQPTARDMFFWNKCEHIDSKFIGSWFDPWDELTSYCDKEVVETRFFLFHPDVRMKPVHVDLRVNDQTLATFTARDKNVHTIAALVPKHFKRPLRISLHTDRLVRMRDLFPEFKHDRKEYRCVGERDILCRDPGMDGVGFYPWENIGNRRFRWTYARQAICDIEVTSPVLGLQLTARKPDLSPSHLSVSIVFSDDKGERISSQDFQIDQQQNDQASIIARFDLSAYIRKTVRLEIKTDRLFCPLDHNIEDSRTLGIYVSEPFWE